MGRRHRHAARGDDRAASLIYAVRPARSRNLTVILLIV